jgi:hypothetical protein
MPPRARYLRENLAHTVLLHRSWHRGLAVKTMHRAWNRGHRALRRLAGGQATRDMQGQHQVAVKATCAPAYGTPSRAHAAGAVIPGFGPPLTAIQLPRASATGSGLVSCQVRQPGPRRDRPAARRYPRPTLNGGQPADDRSDRAVLAYRLACFREVPGSSPCWAVSGSCRGARTGSSSDDVDLVLDRCRSYWPSPSAITLRPSARSAGLHIRGQDKASSGRTTANPWLPYGPAPNRAMGGGPAPASRSLSTGYSAIPADLRGRQLDADHEADRPVLGILCVREPGGRGIAGYIRG